MTDHAPIRIATVKATGRRYILKQIDFRDQVAVCRGEVLKAEGLKTYHGPDQVLPVADITWESVQKTWQLITELFNQGVAKRVEQLKPGQVLTVSAAGRGTETTKAVVNTAFTASDANRCGARTTGRKHTHVTINKPGAARR